MKLALFGQWNGSSGLFYTFPDKLTGLPDWAASIPDPREVKELFNGNNNYGYSLWYNQNGYYYACTKTNTDARNGCVMLALLAGNNVPKDGSLLADKMQSLLDYCLSVQDVSQINIVDVSLKVDEINKLMTNRPLPTDASEDLKKGVAYRIYRSQKELKLFFENPNQSSYVGYKRVLAIDASGVVMGSTHTQSFMQITEAIQRNYDIRSGSDDVFPDKETVVEGEKFGVTYKKNGYADVPMELVAGRSDALSTIEGNTILLKSATEAGIKFKRKVVLKVLDSETQKPIKNWWCKIDRSYTDIKINDDGTRTLSFDPSKTHTIEISADGYQNKTETVSIDEHGIKQVFLQSTDESVLVSLYMEGQIYNDKVRIKSNNELYNPLKQLNEDRKALQVKHGFFSRGNLWPILGVFLVATTAGFFGGRLSKNTPDVQSNIDTSPIEEVANLREKVSKLEDNCSTLKKNDSINHELLEKYQDILRLINEKNTIDVTKVKNILAQEDFIPLMGGDMKDKGKTKEVLEKMINQLNEVVKGGNGTPPKKTEEVKKQEDLAYFAANADSWNLEAIQSKDYKKFVGFILDVGLLVYYDEEPSNSENNKDIIKKFDKAIANLKAYDGSGSSKDYYRNANWEKVCKKLNNYWNSNPDVDQKVIVMRAIQNYINSNKIFDLKGLAESQTLRNY